MALQGTLDTFGLPDVLRLLASTHKTGRLDVVAERGNGTVWLDGGTLVAAHSSATAAVDDMVRVVFELLRHRDGQFSFEAAEHLELTGVPREVDDVVGAAERSLAEWRAVEALVPNLEVWVSLVHDLPDAEVVLDAVRWRTIVAIGAGAQVGAVGDDLGLGEVETCQAVAELVSAGLAVVGEIPADLLDDHAAQVPVSPSPAAAGVVQPASITPAAPALSARPAISEPAVSQPVVGQPVVGQVVASQPVVGSPSVASLDAEPMWQGDWLSTPEAASQTSPVAEIDPSATSPEPSLTPVVSPAPLGDEGWSTGRRSLGIDIPGLPSLSDRWDPEPARPVVEHDDDEVSVELGPLTPLAARAIAMAAQATSEADREAAITQAIEANDQPLDRGVLLRFLSSVRGS